MRITAPHPTLLWAGMEAGKTTICAAVSDTVGLSMHQVCIGNNSRMFDSFSYMEDEDFASPMELPLNTKSYMPFMFETKWHRITPVTLVFIDDVFNIPNGELLYHQICNITPHVVAMGQPGLGPAWSSSFVPDIVGPYSTCELNRFIDESTLRAAHLPDNPDKADRERFDRDYCIAAKPWW